MDLPVKVVLGGVNSGINTVVGCICYEEIDCVNMVLQFGNTCNVPARPSGVHVQVVQCTEIH